MKTRSRFLVLGTVMLFAWTGAQADSVTGNTASSAQNSASSGATNQGNNAAQQITFQNGSVPGHTSVTERFAPSLGGNQFYGSFSQDGCVVSAGGGVSVIGLAVTGAVPVKDEECNARRNFERTMQAAASLPEYSGKLRQAAIDIMCQTDSATYQAYANQGLCSKFVDDKMGNKPNGSAPRTARASVEPVAQAQTPITASSAVRLSTLSKQAINSFYGPG